VNLPDLSDYDLHHLVEDTSILGVRVPGLRSTFFRRIDGNRVAAAGVYTYHGVELYVTWGYADERRCRGHAFRSPDGHWLAAIPGCPAIRVREEDGQVTGLILATATGERLVPDPRLSTRTPAAW
jgi:hypothetical protein